MTELPLLRALNPMSRALGLSVRSCRDSRGAPVRFCLGGAQALPSMTIMGPTAAQDPESLARPQRALRKLDICIFASIALLAAALAGAGAFLLLQGRPRPCQQHQAEAPQDSAHLVAEEVSLKEGTVSWRTDIHHGGLIHGLDFDYHNGTLQVNKDGIYYIYAQLALICVSRSDKPGVVTLYIYREHDGNQKKTILTLTLQLPDCSNSTTSPPPSKFSATLLQMFKNDRLFATMDVKADTLHWQLDDSRGSFLGLFPASRWGTPSQ